jgi:hypothetical protein
MKSVDSMVKNKVIVAGLLLVATICLIVLFEDDLKSLFNQEVEMNSHTPIMADIYRSGGWVSRVIYDENGRAIEQINYPTVYFKNPACEKQGDTTVKWLYSYDGDLLSSEKEIVFCDNAPSYESRTFYSYGKDERIKEILTLNGDGDTVSITFYERPYNGTRISTTLNKLNDGGENECISTDVILQDDGINEHVTTSSSCNAGKRIDYLKIKNATGLVIRNIEYIIHNESDTIRIDESVYYYNENEMISEIRKAYPSENGMVYSPWIEYKYKK